MRRLKLLLLVACVVLGTACTTTPQPPPPATPAASATPEPTPTRPALPPRPRELRLDGVDPCALLTPSQRADLGLSAESSPTTSGAPGFAGPACAIAGFEPRAVAVGVSLSTGNSISVLTGPESTDEISPITVAGFPAILARPDNPDFCSVDIDVAEGQFLDIQFRDGGLLPPIPQDQLCLDAGRVAEYVMQTLKNG